MKIHAIQIETASLRQALDFYHGMLGLPYMTEGNKAYFQTGDSQLAFVENESFKGIYHFAFNIPCNQIREAMAWLERAGVMLIANSNGDIRIGFPDWNAEATYFFDSAGNIVELIARRDLYNEREQSFSHDSLLEISEIGVVTDDVPAWVNRAETTYGVRPFDKQKPGAEFAALGSDMGLFIVVKTGRKWFLTDLPAVQVPLKVRFETDRGVVMELVF